MLSAVAAVFRSTFLENVRNKFFYVLLLFGAILLGFSFLFGLLGVDLEVRLIQDLGLISAELLSLFTVIFLSVTLVLEEVRTRTIYLILIRPVPRGAYLLGRYLGMLATAALALGVMAILLAGLLLLKGWRWEMWYPAVMLGIFLKIVLISAVGMFWALFSSSAVLSTALTFFFWILGHFGEELRFLAKRVEPAAVAQAMKVVYLLLPNFQYVNWKDRILREVFTQRQFLGVDAAAAAGGIGYCLLYAAFCYFLALACFRRKEF